MDFLKPQSLQAHVPILSAYSVAAFPRQSWWPEQREERVSLSHPGPEKTATEPRCLIDFSEMLQNSIPFLTKKILKFKIKSIENHSTTQKLHGLFPGALCCALWGLFGEKTSQKLHEHIGALSFSAQLTVTPIQGWLETAGFTSKKLLSEEKKKKKGEIVTVRRRWQNLKRSWSTGFPLWQTYT